MSGPPRALAAGLAAAGFGAAVLALSWTALDLLPGWQTSHRLVAMWAAFIPYAVPAWALALAVAWYLPRRRLLRSLALLPLAGLLVQAALCAPYVPHAAPRAEGERLRILTLNTLYGKADPQGLAGTLAAEHPDVVVLLEVETHALATLEAAGALAAYPHRAGSAEPGWDVTGHESAVGTLVLSRTPLTELERLPSAMGQYVVRVQRRAGDVTLIAAHPLNMVSGVGNWVAEGDLLAATAHRYAGSRLVVAGDLNAVREHVTFRRLAAVGLTDATAASGAGWTPTFSADGPLPPLIQIDHVLADDRFTATACRSFAVRHTDHRGLVADLVIRS